MTDWILNLSIVKMFCISLGMPAYSMNLKLGTLAILPCKAYGYFPYYRSFSLKQMVKVDSLMYLCQEKESAECLLIMHLKQSGLKMPTAVLLVNNYLSVCLLQSKLEYNERKNMMICIFNQFHVVWANNVILVIKNIPE